MLGHLCSFEPHPDHVAREWPAGIPALCHRSIKRRTLVGCRCPVQPFMEPRRMPSRRRSGSTARLAPPCTLCYRSAVTLIEKMPVQEAAPQPIDPSVPDDQLTLFDSLPDCSDMISGLSPASLDDRAPFDTRRQASAMNVEAPIHTGPELRSAADSDPRRASCVSAQTPRF
jgi:hypothetical protein